MDIRQMITVIKLDPQGIEKICYTGEILKRTPNEIVIQANWTLPIKDLGYTYFEPGDCFTEYYYTDRWFNIFEICAINGTRKGWYCNITEPAQICEASIVQVDLFLDVWVNPQGKYLLLDEDEFAATHMLSKQQRSGAQQGLKTLLQMIEDREDTFSTLLEKDSMN